MTIDTKPPTPKRRAGDARPWLVIGCLLLCPLKVVILAAVGGGLGGLLGMPGLPVIAAIVVAGGGWVIVRMLRRRGARCRPPATPPRPGQLPRRTVRIGR